MSSYIELIGQLNGRCHDSRKVGNNTYLCRRSGSHGDSVAVRFHNTDVLWFTPEGDVFVNTGGWTTVITKDRINYYLPDGFHVHSTGKKDRWGDPIWAVTKRGPHNPRRTEVEAFASFVKAICGLGEYDWTVADKFVYKVPATLDETVLFYDNINLKQWDEVVVTDAEERASDKIKAKQEQAAQRAQRAEQRKIQAERDRLADAAFEAEEQSIMQEAERIARINRAHLSSAAFTTSIYSR